MKVAFSGSVGSGGGDRGRLKTIERGGVRDYDVCQGRKENGCECKASY